MAAEKRKPDTQDIPGWTPPPLRRCARQDAAAILASLYGEKKTPKRQDTAAILASLHGEEKTPERLRIRILKASEQEKSPVTALPHRKQKRRAKRTVSSRIKLALTNISHAIDMLGEARETYILELQKIYTEMHALKKESGTSTEDVNGIQSVIKLLENCAEVNEFVLEKPLMPKEVLTPPTPPVSP